MSPTPSAPPPVLGHPVSKSGSYSLLLLFYLTTLAAIVVATGRLAFASSTINWRFLGWSAALIILMSCVLGSIVGWILAQRVIGLALGLAVGVGTGILATCFSMILPDQFLTANLLLFGGAWVLIATALLASRWRSA